MDARLGSTRLQVGELPVLHMHSSRGFAHALQGKTNRKSQWQDDILIYKVRPVVAQPLSWQRRA
jgi:hypothetical protein